MAVPAVVALCLAGWNWPAPEAHADGLMGGGGPLPPVPCVSAQERVQIQDAISAYKLRGGADAIQRIVGGPRKYPFYPLGGTLYSDLFTNNFNDLDPTSGILDWDCTDFTYDGHDATDVDLRTFGEQVIGVPIFAALDGTVIATHDGEDDMHTSCFGPANYVIIDHGGGRYCYYLHMRRNSVAVIAGQPVHAGQPLGMVASSGCSTGPHLHFASYDNSTSIEPYRGSCQPNPSQWLNQTPIFRTMYLRDFNITNVLIENYPGLPVDMPRTGTFVSGPQNVSFWINLMNMPASSRWRIRYRRPNATIAFDSGTVGFGGNPFYRWSWWWWRYGVNLNTVGTWNILLDINGLTIITAPFTVVATAGEIVNRPPNAINATFDTNHPRVEDAIFCRVQTSLTLDDPDYDIVRYRYVWKVNNVEVRNVATAGYADAIPRYGVCTGDLVECAVTPMDAVASGPTVTPSMIVAPVAPVPGDLSGNGYVGTEDIPAFVNVILGFSSACEERITSDVNSDAAADGQDIDPFLQRLLGPLEWKRGSE